MTRLSVIAIVSILLPAAACSLDLDALRGTDEPTPEGGPTQAADSEPPPMSDAEVVLRPFDSGPSPTCGRVGLPCCLPGSTCETGACLRGTCAVFGGAFSSMSACAPDCQSRNPYTAGCSCPPGFAPAPVVQLIGSCGGSVSPTSVSVCTALGVEPIGDFAGLFVGADDGGCDAGCLLPNARTGGCTCPDGTTTLSLRVEAPSSCASAEPATLGLCRRETDVITFAGAFQRDGDGSCTMVNPQTGVCACEEGAMEQTVATLPAPIHLCAR